MFKNFLKVTLRTLSREKVYAFINISGLSLAVAFCLIIGLYLRNELTYDKHNTKHKQIYRLVTELDTSGKIDKFIYSSQTVGKKLADEYADVKDYVRFLPINRQVLLQYEDKSFYWSKTAFVSNNVFEVFDHEFIYGDPKTARTEPFCAVSESFAKKYWGNENPVGKIFTSEGNGTKVTHVFKDLPVNSHYKYDVLYSDNVPFLNTPEDKYTLWKHRFYTYLVMSEDYNVSDFEGISDSFYKRHMIETGKENNMSIRFMIEPLADIHYYSDAGYDLPKGNRYYLYGFTAVAIFILLVACINYMNLATARAARRLKEVGIRKILGSGRSRLITQFLGESIFFSFIAMLAGYAIVELILNLTPVNELMQTTLVLDLKNEPMLPGWMLVFCLGLGFVSGIYPAFYLSAIAPVSTLIKNPKTGKNKTGFRELLVLVQFIISVTVIACTIII
ncbi:MAG: FtsX-like permease family protein, partial [Desulfobacteraceae bacterium]